MSLEGQFILCKSIKRVLLEYKKRKDAEVLEGYDPKFLEKEMNKAVDEIVRTIHGDADAAAIENNNNNPKKKEKIEETWKEYCKLTVEQRLKHYAKDSMKTLFGNSKAYRDYLYDHFNTPIHLREQ